jgi:hypothetical protein
MTAADYQVENTKYVPTAPAAVNWSTNFAGHGGDQRGCERT